MYHSRDCYLEHGSVAGRLKKAEAELAEYRALYGPLPATPKP